MRVLFVDDEVRVLDGIRRALFDLDERWEIETADGTEAALAIMGSREVDVLVTDMRMPGRDGAALLAEVVERYPRCIRYVLSGQADEADAIRATRVAHRFLRKPCDPAELENALANAAHLVDLTQNAALRSLVGGVNSLPILPAVYRGLTALAEGDGASAGRVAALVRQEPSLAAKVLQVVNSAFFSRGARVSDVARAVALLGDRLVMNIAMLVGVWNDVPGVPTALVERMQEHALEASVVAKALTPNRADDTPATAALLADLGWLVLARAGVYTAEQLGLALGPGSGEAQLDERAAHGFTHADVGAYLLALWGLPEVVVRAVREHHAPIDPAAVGRGDAPAIVALAHALVAGASAPAALLADPALAARIAHADAGRRPGASA